MNARFSLLIMAMIMATPVLAVAPLAKRVPCQPAKPGPRDVKRIETCRRPPAIPPVIDPTPLFLASTNSAPPIRSDLS